MTPGGFCYVTALPGGELSGYHVVHRRSNQSEAIIFPFVEKPATATRLAQSLNLEICERLQSKTADELRRLARLILKEDREPEEFPVPA